MPLATAPLHGDPQALTIPPRETELLDHYWHVQQQEQARTAAHRWARQARRYAIFALASSGIGMLLATIALLTGRIHG
jgi:hypothetical protein